MGMSLSWSRGLVYDKKAKPFEETVDDSLRTDGHFLSPGHMSTEDRQEEFRFRSGIVRNYPLWPVALFFVSVIFRSSH